MSDSHLSLPAECVTWKGDMSMASKLSNNKYLPSILPMSCPFTPSPDGWIGVIYRLDSLLQMVRFWASTTLCIYRRLESSTLLMGILISMLGVFEDKTACMFLMTGPAPTRRDMLG